MNEDRPLMLGTTGRREVVKMFKESRDISSFLGKLFLDEKKLLSSERCQGK